MNLKKNLYTAFTKNHGYVELIQYMGKDVITPVNAARASFGVQIEELQKRDKKLFSYCVREGHTSILEHNTLTFAIKVPLFVARQHMRHRTWSYNEISRRYTSKDLDFYLPEKFLQSQNTLSLACWTSIPDEVKIVIEPYRIDLHSGNIKKTGKEEDKELFATKTKEIIF